MLKEIELFLIMIIVIVELILYQCVTKVLMTLALVHMTTNKTKNIILK